MNFLQSKYFKTYIKHIRSESIFYISIYVLEVLSCQSVRKSILLLFVAFLMFSFVLLQQTIILLLFVTEVEVIEKVPRKEICYLIHFFLRKLLKSGLRKKND